MDRAGGADATGGASSDTGAGAIGGASSDTGAGATGGAGSDTATESRAHRGRPTAPRQRRHRRAAVTLGRRGPGARRSRVLPRPPVVAVGVALLPARAAAGPG